MSLFDKSRVYKGRAIENLVSPNLNTPEVFGTAGSATVEYVVTYRSLVGETTPSPVVTFETAPDTLGSLNYMILSVTSVDPNAVAVRYYKKDGAVYKLLQETTALSGSNGKYAIAYDKGSTLTPLQDDVLVPTENTSGRPQWRAMLWNFDRYVQRPELMDMQLMLQLQQKKIADITHKNGDLVSYAGESYLGNNTWTFPALEMYIDGQVCSVPGGTVTIPATGEVSVGIIVTPTIVTSTDDSALWNLDTPGDLADVNRGADRLVYEYEWTYATSDDPKANMLTVQTFIDNSPKELITSPERSVLEKAMADREYDIHGNFVIYPFATEMVEHEEPYGTPDTSKMTLKVKSGRASIKGYKFIHTGSQSLDVDKARDTGFVNTGSTSAFNHFGGSTTGTTSEPFNVDGLKVTLRVGNGNSHTVTLSGTTETASTVAVQISNAINGILTYPSNAIIVPAGNTEGQLYIRAQHGKSLHIEAVSGGGDAYTALGLTVGEYTPTGTRLYTTDKQYVKDVSDILYDVDAVFQCSYNSGTKRAFVVAGMSEVYGAADTAANAEDGIFDYIYPDDFEVYTNDNDYALWTSANEPGSTVYISCKYRKEATAASLRLFRATNVPITKGEEGGADEIVIPSGTVITKVSDGSTTTLGQDLDVTNANSIVWANSALGQLGTAYSGYSINKNSSVLEHVISEIQWDSVVVTQPATNETYYCEVLFWRETSAGDVVVANSYGPDYDYIESFGFSDPFSLRDCLDFRTSGIMPKHGESVDYEFNYYLSRIDKLMVDENGSFSIIRGEPAIDPPMPNSPSDMLCLEIFEIPPYTYSADDVTSIQVAPVRQTQAALERLAKQVESLQYDYTTRSWENEVASQVSTTDARGIFSDALTGYSKFDLSFNRNGIYHNAELDRRSRLLRLKGSRQLLDLAIDEDNSTGWKRMGNTLVLDYTPVAFDSQPYATTAINCAYNYVYDNYEGSIDIQPAVDVFLDTTQRPSVKYDLDMGLQPLLDEANAANIADIDFGRWKTTKTKWIGPWGTYRHYQQRIGTYDSYSLADQEIELGNSVVDMSLVGFMRTQNEDGSDFEVKVRCRQLQPLQDHKLTINNIPVNFVYDSAADDPKGAAGSVRDGYQTVATDTKGFLTGKFAMPAGVEAGTAIIRVFHHSDPTSSWASTTFSSAGLLQTQQSTTLGYQSATVKQETVTQNRSVVEVRWVDPLAQSFMVKDRTRYISEMDIYFRTVSDEYSLDIEVREMTNGYPNSNVVATAEIKPGEGVASADGSVPTRVEFKELLGYKPDTEYCFVPKPGKNNTDYEVWVAVIGQKDVRDPWPTVEEPPHDGVLFQSPNARTWIPLEKTYLKFTLYECNFMDEATIRFEPLSGENASRIVTAVEQYAGPGTKVQWYYSYSGADNTWIPYDSDVETDLGQNTTLLYLKVNLRSVGAHYSLVEHIAALALLSYETTSYVVFQRDTFDDQVDNPNKIIATADLDYVSDSYITATPIATGDNGDNWFTLKASPGYTPLMSRGDFMYRHRWETPDETTISGATGNGEAMVLTIDEDHLWTVGMLGTVAGMGGNTAANAATWRIGSISDTTISLVDPDTGEALLGNGAYTNGGTITFAEFDELRPGFKLETTNNVRSPYLGNAGFVARRD